VFGVGVDAHRGGLAGHTHHHREASDSQIASLLAEGLSDMLAAAVITHCAIVAATTDRTTREGGVS
jgi:hypothetical protein